MSKRTRSEDKATRDSYRILSSHFVDAFRRRSYNPSAPQGGIRGSPMRFMSKRKHPLLILCLTIMSALASAQSAAPTDSVWIRNGKIFAVGDTINVPPNSNLTFIDAGGKYLTPGIIDSHSHIALDDDVNEATSPVTPQMMMKDAFDYQDKAIYRALAGGVTTSLLLHGSANMIGGQAVVIKHKYGATRDELLFPNAPRSIKFASGENPKRVYGS